MLTAFSATPTTVVTTPSPPAIRKHTIHEKTSSLQRYTQLRHSTIMPRIHSSRGYQSALWCEKRCEFALLYNMNLRRIHFIHIEPRAGGLEVRCGEGQYAVCILSELRQNFLLLTNTSSRRGHCYLSGEDLPVSRNTLHAAADLGLTTVMLLFQHVLAEFYMLNGGHQACRQHGVFLQSCVELVELRVIFPL
jgi:hypothetical protein